MKIQIAVVALAILFVITACAAEMPTIPAPTETIAPNVGKVVGTLQVGSGKSVAPVRGVLLYLAGQTKDAAGNDVFLGFDRALSPHTVTDEQGHFSFSGVPPGNYGLTMDFAIRSFLLNKPDLEEALMINVSGGKLSDLGILVYESLPLIPQPRPYPYP